VLHGLSQCAQAGVSLGFRRRARVGIAVGRVGIAVGLSLAFIAASSSPALADQARRNEWWLRTLHATNAWETTRGSGVTVAVVDTGVDPAQADLTGSVTTGPDYTNSGETAGGPLWGVHGTEVASLIAGHGHGPGQANGIIGVAPAAKILSVRVTLEGNDPSLSKQTVAAGLPNAIARGIDWAVRHHATVIDLPLDPVTTSGATGSGGSTAERAAVNYALSKHVVLVAPAGDGGTGTNAVNYPADYHGVIAVGAFDRHFVKAPFSSHQSYVTVTAAGAGVTAGGPSGTYPQLNSTSAASAMVAGIVALIQAQFPALSPAQVTHAITMSTVFHPPGGRANGSGFGTVDAAKALIAAASIVESVPKSAASGTAGQAAPSPPATHSSPIHRNIRGTLIKDAIIAGVVFLLLLGLIFAITAWRRRNARSARLAEVRAAVQPPVRKPVVAKSAARGSAKKGSPAGTQAGLSGPHAEEAESQLEPTGFIAAPLGPTAGGPGASGFTGSAAGFTGSGFAGSGTGFTGSGFTGSGFAGSGFTGSASSGFAAAGPTSAVSGGLSFGAAGISRPGGIAPPAGLGPAAASGSPAGPGATGISPPAGTSPAGGINPAQGLGPAAGLGSSAAGDPPAGLGPSAGLSSAAGLGSAAGFGSAPGFGSEAGAGSKDASAAGEATPGLTQPAGAGTGLPPWALISQDPTAKAAASAAIPGSAFPGAPAAPSAGEAASGTEPASGAAGAARMSSRLTQSPRQSRAPQVSGRPPWEPAAEPNSDLPWTQASAPSHGGTGSLPMPEQVRSALPAPALPAWEEMAQQAWPGGPKAAALHPPVPPADEPNARPGREGGRPGAARIVPAAGLVPPRPASPEQPRQTENLPDYAWNPGAAVEPFRAAQADPGPAPGAAGAAQAGNGPSAGAASPSASAPSPSAGAASSAVNPSAASPSAVSQPGVSLTRRPSLALPRRLGSSMAREAGSAAAVGGVTPVGGDVAGQTPAGGLVVPGPAGGLAVPGLTSGLPVPGPAGGLAVPGQAGGGVAGSGVTGPASDGPDWPVTGVNQPPFPPAPRPATDLGPPGVGQLERGPFPRAIKPPTDPGAAGTAAWGPSTTGAEPPGGSPAGPALSQGGGPAKGPGPAKAGQPGTGAALPTAARPGASKRGAAKPAAAKPEAGSTRPKTGVPPWEITDSFLAVPPADASASSAPSAPTASPPGGPRAAPPWDTAPIPASPPSGATSWSGEPTEASQPGGASTWAAGSTQASQPAGVSTWGGGPAAASPPSGATSWSGEPATADQLSGASTWAAGSTEVGRAGGTPPWGSAPVAADQPGGASAWGGPAAVSQPGGASAWGGPAAVSQPGKPSGADTEAAGSADSTESFPAVGSGVDQRSFPGTNPGDSTESFPPMRPRADMEDAFRLFPPVRGTGNRPSADGKD
jgi:serine protease